MRTWVITTLAILISCSGLAQNVYKLGEKDFTQDKEQALVFTSYKKVDSLRLRDSVDLSFMMPPAGDQRDKGSCWAWATAYAIRSVMDNTKNFKAGSELNTNAVYSPEYVYQYYKGDLEDCEWGAYSYDMLDRILKDGVVKLSDLPYSNACNIRLTKRLKSEAKLYAKSGYIVEKLNDLYSIKKVLADSQALVISIKVDDYFCTRGNITASNPFWNVFNTREGSHAMVVVGYNDSLKALKVLNSWGQSFGDNGYVWISYSIINSAMNYCCYPKNAITNLPVTRSSREDTFDNNSGSEQKGSLSTWFKKGYFRPFENLKLVLAELNASKGFAVVEVRNARYDLLTNFYIDLKSSKEFYIDGKKYNFTLNEIAGAGNNPFTKAAYFTIERTKLP